MDYLIPLLSGILFGIPFCLAVGPVFFLIIQTGINKGVKLAIAIALGVVLADITLILLTNIFVNQLNKFLISNYHIIIYILCVILLLYGSFSIFKQAQTRLNDRGILTSSFSFFLFNGFVLDVLNPSNVLVWIGVNASIIQYDFIQHSIFYGSTVVTIAALMVGLAVFSSAIKKRLTAINVRRLNISLGIFYIGIAVFLFFGENVILNTF